MVAAVETSPGSLATVLSRSQLMERIGQLNPTATATFLSGFADSALALYLEHLHAKLVDTDATRPWRRPGDTPAILHFEPSSEA